MKYLVITLSIIGVLCILTFGAIWFFYSEEDARGVHEWALVQKSIQDAGENIDAHDLIPPEIPDDQNMASLPLFKRESAPGDKGSLQSVAMNKAMANISPDYVTLPKAGSWLKSEATDTKALNEYITARYKNVFGDKDDGIDVLAQFDVLCPALNELREASATRPQYRVAQDYLSVPPYDRPMSASLVLIKVSKISNLHSLVALEENRPDVALNDIKVVFKIDEGVRREPLLISGLVANASFMIQLNTVWEGLNSHEWTDQQLTELEEELGKIDFLANYQLCIRGEGVCFWVPTMDYLRDHRSSAARAVIGSANLDDNGAGGTRLIAALLPRGWFDMAKARGLALYFEAAKEPVDIAKRRFYPDKADLLKQKAKSMTGYDFPSILLRVMSGPVFGASANFASTQCYVDMARIACALERYHLAQGSYPESLEALKPYAPRDLPLDLMSGEPYHYKLKADGTYLLYSVGWNQKDDEGKVVYKANDRQAINREQGDWVWPSPKNK